VENLGTILRHVDTGRTVGCTRLARQAQVEGAFNARVIPRRDEFAVRDLLQDPRPRIRLVIYRQVVLIVIQDELPTLLAGNVVIVQVLGKTLDEYLLLLWGWIDSYEAHRWTRKKTKIEITDR